MKHFTLNLMLPVFIVVGILMASNGYVSWSTFGLISISHCTLTTTWYR